MTALAPAPTPTPAVTVDPCAALGVVPLINAAGTLSRYSGAALAPEVVAAMAAVSDAFVDMHELHVAAGRRVAALLGVEAAHVCAGAAAGIVLMAAACMAGNDNRRIAQLPDTSGMRHRFLVQRTHRNAFDAALRLAGAEIVEVESDEDALASALATERETLAGVFHTLSWFLPSTSVPLPRVCEIARAAGLPVIVDAAAELPPADNLTRFLREGADLVAISGGKALRGPQASGLVLGRADLVEACRLNDAPHSAVGRPAKAGKEQIVGLVKAIELYLSRDHDADLRQWEERVARVIALLSEIEDLRAWRAFPHPDGQRVPHAAVSWDEPLLGVTHAEAVRTLLAGAPRIAVHLVTPETYGADAFGVPEIRVRPQCLRDGEEIVVARRIREVLQR